jgi:hypothetical protein
MCIIHVPLNIDIVFAGVKGAVGDLEEDESLGSARILEIGIAFGLGKLDNFRFELFAGI